MADIKKLQSVGICTVKGVMMTTKKRLAEIKGLSEAKVDKIKEAACKISVSVKFSFNGEWHYPAFLPENLKIKFFAVPLHRSYWMLYLLWFSSSAASLLTPNSKERASLKYACKGS